MSGKRRMGLITVESRGAVNGEKCNNQLDVRR